MSTVVTNPTDPIVGVSECSQEGCTLDAVLDTQYDYTYVSKLDPLSPATQPRYIQEIDPTVPPTINKNSVYRCPCGASFVKWFADEMNFTQATKATSKLVTKVVAPTNVVAQPASQKDPS